MVHKSPPKDDMDRMVLEVVRNYPNRRLANIHYDQGVRGMDYQDTRSTLERLTRNGQVERTLHTHGFFSYYTYHLPRNGK